MSWALLIGTGLFAWMAISTLIVWHVARTAPRMDDELPPRPGLFKRISIVVDRRFGTPLHGKERFVGFRRRTDGAEPMPPKPSATRREHRVSRIGRRSGMIL